MPTECKTPGPFRVTMIYSGDRPRATFHGYKLRHNGENPDFPPMAIATFDDHTDATQRQTVVDLLNKGTHFDALMTAIKDLLSDPEIGFCSRIKVGECTTRKCLQEGGYTGGPFDPCIATCDVWRAHRAMGNAEGLP